MANSANVVTVGSAEMDRFVTRHGKAVASTAAEEARIKVAGVSAEQTTRAHALRASRTIAQAIAADPNRSAEGINREFCTFYDVVRNGAREQMYDRWDQENRLHRLNDEAVLAMFESGENHVLSVVQTIILSNLSKEKATAARKKLKSAINSDKSPIIYSKEVPAQEGEPAILRSYTRNTPAPQGSRRDYGSAGRNRVNTYTDLYTLCVYFLDPKGGNDSDYLSEILNPVLSSPKSGNVVPVTERVALLKQRLRDKVILNSTTPIEIELDSEGQAHIPGAYEHFTDAQRIDLNLTGEKVQVPLGKTMTAFLQEKKVKTARVKNVARGIDWIDENCGMHHVHLVEADKYPKE